MSSIGLISPVKGGDGSPDNSQRFQTAEFKRRSDVNDTPEMHSQAIPGQSRLTAAI